MKTALFFLVKIAAVLSDIVLVPSNTAVMAGEKMDMNCLTTNDSEVRKWTIYSLSRAFSTIYKHGPSGGFHEHFTHFHAEINANGPVIISANSTRSSDAGIYKCHYEIDRKDAEYSAHLIVLESLPMCESNLTRKYSYNLIDGDHIWIQCSINFRGFWAPSMEWIEHGGEFGSDGKTVTDGIETMISPSQSVTSKLTIVVNSSISGSYYSCNIFFANYSDTEVTTADNVPSFTYTWNSSVIYASHSSTQSVTTATDTGRSSAATSPTTEKSSSVDWYLVSLSVFSALFIFFILIVAVTIACYIRFKKKVSAKYASTALEELEMPTHDGNYDILPYATSDNYETIDEALIESDLKVSFPPRQGPLPTPGYSGLMQTEPTAPGVYSRMDTYETPEDITPGSKNIKFLATLETTSEKQVDDRPSKEKKDGEGEGNQTQVKPHLELFDADNPETISEKQVDDSEEKVNGKGEMDSQQDGNKSTVHPYIELFDVENDHPEECKRTSDCDIPSSYLTVNF